LVSSDLETAGARLVVKTGETVMRLGLDVVHRTGLDKLASRILPRDGVIFALHRVKPAEPNAFAPNQILEVTPEFLEDTIKTVRASGFDIVSLDEALPRIGSGAGRPFACFTLDDAYRDNKDYAVPVLAKHGVPFTIYVPEHFADGTGEIWWVELERAIEASQNLSVSELFPGMSLNCETAEEKTQVFNRIYWLLRQMDEAAARRIVRRLCARAGVEVSELCQQLIMSWDELRVIAQSPLASFGAHTIGHYAVAKLHPPQALYEMTSSKQRIEKELGRPCAHFCYPYGDTNSAGARDFALAAKAGFVSAVTMQKGLIESRHRNALLSLPRCSLNGGFQDQRYVAALLSGLPFALWNAANGRFPSLRQTSASKPARHSSGEVRS
jgi:peptidoglycan/xylan/chitin deacetylase (PgdA/CDA1 family)